MIASAYVGAKPSRVTLEAAPDRASRFLRGVANNPRIRAALATEGYAEEDHQEGWDLFHTACGYRPRPAAPTLDLRSATAMAELDRLDGPLLDKVDATLAHRFPPQRDALIGDLTAGERAIAVYNVKTLLDRLTTLEKSTTPDDQAALARLAKVRVDADERQRLATLVADAEHFESDSGATQETDEARWTRLEHDFFALWAWLDEWTRASQRAISRRDWRITLGIGKRRKKNTPADPDPADA